MWPSPVSTFPHGRPHSYSCGTNKKKLPKKPEIFVRIDRKGKFTFSPSLFAFRRRSLFVSVLGKESIFFDVGTSLRNAFKRTNVLNGLANGKYSKKQCRQRRGNPYGANTAVMVGVNRIRISGQTFEGANVVSFQFRSPPTMENWLEGRRLRSKI